MFILHQACSLHLHLAEIFGKANRLLYIQLALKNFWMFREI